MHNRTLAIHVGTVTASTTTRTLGGVVVRYGVAGRTSAGRLKVRRGALRFPADLSRVKLTREHELDNSRGHLASIVDDGAEVRAALKVSDGPEGDAALREADDKTRDGLSFHVVDAVIEGDEIVDALVVAIGQVGVPAYDDGRIDSIAASAALALQEGSTMLTEAQRARLEELRGRDTELNEDERRELAALDQLDQLDDGGDDGGDEGADSSSSSSSSSDSSSSSGEGVTAAMAPAGGPPRRRAPARTRPRRGALDTFVSTVASAVAPGGGGLQAITAALTDATYTEHSHAMAPAWSGELWSGLDYVPEFTPLLNSGDMTALKGQGWRWVTKPVMADYAGDKAAIPSNELATEPAEYTGARMAVGHDIDRAFYDFPSEDFLRSYAEAARESWAQKLDAKVEAYIIANAVATGLAATDSMLKAVMRVTNRVRRAKLGRATFVVVSADDYEEQLLDVTSQNAPAYLELLGVNPASFVPSEDLASGTVIAGVKQAATVRTLPGSPIRVSAQHIANGGIDEAFFGYWAIEEHHESAILSDTFTPPV